MLVAVSLMTGWFEWQRATFAGDLGAAASASIHHVHLAPSGSVSGQPGGGEGVVLAGAGENVAFRVLAMEASVATVTDEMRRELAEIIRDASVAIGRLERPQGRWNRRYALAVLGCIDATLIRHGFVHPASGAVDLLADALAPFRMTSEERDRLVAMPQNGRRTAMIGDRYPGPFRVVDCDTASLVYLGVAEDRGLPLRMVLIPSRNRRIAHTFVRWREGSRFVDWETTEGRERSGMEAALDRRDRLDRGRSRTVELELSRDEVLGAAHYLLGVRRERRGEFAAALQEFATALELFPGHWDARRQFAWITATGNPVPERDILEAIAHASYVVERADDADAHDTLAAVYAAAGRFDLAVREEQAALSDEEATAGARAGYRHRLELYRQGSVYRRP